MVVQGTNYLRPWCPMQCRLCETNLFISAPTVWKHKHNININSPSAISNLPNMFDVSCDIQCPIPLPAESSKLKRFSSCETTWEFFEHSVITRKKLLLGLIIIIPRKLTIWGAANNGITEVPTEECSCGTPCWPSDPEKQTAAWWVNVHAGR